MLTVPYRVTNCPLDKKEVEKACSAFAICQIVPFISTSTQLNVFAKYCTQEDLFVHQILVDKKIMTTNYKSFCIHELFAMTKLYTSTIRIRWSPLSVDDGGYADTSFERLCFLKKN
jgi:hypothetical protein